MSVTAPSTYAALLRSLGDEGNTPEHGTCRPKSAPCQDFITPAGTLSRSRGDVLAEAERRGSQLLALGLGANARIGIIVTDPWEFLPLIHGCLLYGLTAVPMYPPPLFTRMDSYRSSLDAILGCAQVDLLITDRGLPARLGALSARSVELDQLPTAEVALTPDVSPNSLALLQFTSGSTQAPKGVRITHQALMANAHAIMVDGLKAMASDRGVSWLPLYHDMGLIGFGLAPLLTDTPVTFIPTARFIRSPAVWLQTLHETQATITFAPNFAYSLVTRRTEPQGLDLKRVRMWGCGAEPISEKVLTHFEHHFAEAGVKPGSVAPCYGLAEATLAVCFTPPGGPREVLRLDARAWEVEQVARPTDNGALAVVSCGRPLPGYAVHVVDEHGADAGERVAGEVVVTGPSLGDGYEGNTSESARAFAKFGLLSGDRGFINDGQLFVTGRIKDTLIVNGRKYDPHVLEHWAEQVPGVRRAAAVTVESPDGEAFAMLIECAGDEGVNLVEKVRVQLASHVGIQPTHTLALAPNTLPRTTSGKLRRNAARLMAKQQLGDS